MAFNLEAAKRNIALALDSSAEEFVPNTLVSVFKDGESIFRKAYGSAKESDRFVSTLESPLFLTLITLLLAQQKKLRLSDRLSRFVPEYKHAGEITVRNLLDRKTGIRDFFYGEIMRKMNENFDGISDEERRLRDTAASAKYYSIEDVLAEIGELDLEAKPGTEEQWGMGDAPFLRTVCERAAGESLWSFAEKNIFRPLGMSNTASGGGNIEYTLLFRNEKPISFLPEQNNPYIFTTDLPDCEKLLLGLFGGKLLSEKSYSAATDFRKVNGRWGFELMDGIIYCCLDFYGTFGSGVLYHDPGTGASAVALASEEGKYIVCDSGDSRFFRRDLRSVLAEEFTFPKSTKMVRYNKKNCLGAMRLEVTKEQLDFVDDAKTTICYAAAYPNHRLFVEEESGRAVGLLDLYVDKKKQQYEISIVLIDKRYQHRGFGKIMLRFAVDYLKSQGARRLTIGVNRFNLPAQALYRSVGFTEDNVFEEGMIMSQKLCE